MQPALASHSELDRLGRLTLAGVVGAGLAASVFMSEAPILAVENLGIVGVGSIFLAILVTLGDRLTELPTVTRVGYFGLQLLLASVVFLLQARLDSFGMAGCGSPERSTIPRATASLWRTCRSRLPGSISNAIREPSRRLSPRPPAPFDTPDP